MLRGYVQKKDILGHPLLFCRSFGIHFYCHCLWQVFFCQRDITFLDIFWHRGEK